MTQNEFNTLVECAMMDMRLTKERKNMWARLEVTQFGVPNINVFVGFYNSYGEKEEYVSIRSYYMGQDGPTFKSITNG